MTLRRAALVVGALAAFALFARVTSQSAPATRDGVFIHLSHGTEDPHGVAMALQMARMMSADKDVLV